MNDFKILERINLPARQMPENEILDGYTVPDQLVVISLPLKKYFNEPTHTHTILVEFIYDELVIPSRPAASSTGQWFVNHFDVFIMDMDLQNATPDSRILVHVTLHYALDV